MESRTALLNLPRLDLSNAERHSRKCKVCSAPALFFDVVDFNKCHNYVFGPSGVYVSYYRCEVCRFIFTDFFDDWSFADFTQFVYNDDLHLVDVDYQLVRPRKMALDYSRILHAYKSSRILDYGAGTGIFAKLMEGEGFNITAFDPVSIPARPSGRFDIITCFECIEHSPDPVGIITDLASFLTEDGLILFSQTLQPLDIDTIRCNWWYASPRNGHVSLYNTHSLSLLSNNQGWEYYNGNGAHAFCRLGSSFSILALMFGARTSVPIVLGAPAVDANDSFHFLEGVSNGYFRWTKCGRISWPITAPQGVLQIRIPYVGQICAGYSLDCKVIISDYSVVRIPDPTEIVVEITGYAGGNTVVELITPPPMRPIDVNGNDDLRELGLAIKAVNP